jgi:hypothetical protein
MTRKHFEQIASILNGHAADEQLIRDMARMCASENERFDRERFYIACGL